MDLPPERPGYRLVAYHPTPASKFHPQRLVGTYRRERKRETAE